jgi:hypothetical protein
VLDKHEAAIERIKPILAGRGIAEQSAIIADLLAIWLAGHRILDDKPGAAEAQAQLREEVLANHIALVRSFLPLADMVVDARLAGKPTGGSGRPRRKRGAQP